MPISVHTSMPQALTESAGGAEKAALQQLEDARKECGALQEKVGP